MKKTSRFPNVSIFLLMVRRFPAYVLECFLNFLLIALPSYVGNVLFLSYILRALPEGRPVREILSATLALAVYLLLSDAYIAYFSNVLRPKSVEKIQKWFYHHLKQTTQSYDLYVYDDPAFLDDITYVSGHIVEAATSSIAYFSNIVSALINIVLIANLFAQVGVKTLGIVAVATAISVICNLFTVRLGNRKRFEMNRIGRKKGYFYSIFFHRGAFMERKMSSVGDLLDKEYQSSIEEEKACNRKYGLKFFLFDTLRDVLSSNLLLYFILFAYLLYETAVTHNLRGSDFVAAYNASNVIVASIMEAVNVWGRLKENAYTVRKYQSVLRRSPESGQASSKEPREMPDIHTIELRNVSFTYPGTQKEVLKDINLTLRKGDKIAIVGQNGSGKTTLVHVLMGFYEPSKGEIRINGEKIGAQDYPLYRRQFAAFFQGMAPFEATVAENVALGTNYDLEKVRGALERTKSEKLLSRPLDTPVGVQFDPAGLILSGGEYQKLLLAYCFYSEKSLLVMDEPSSALDPTAERNFNLQLAELADNKLAVFVTHRLTTVHMASYIYVLQDGVISAKGTHDQLVSQEGIYKRMWTIQAKKYGVDT